MRGFCMYLENGKIYITKKGGVSHRIGDPPHDFVLTAKAPKATNIETNDFLRI